MRRLVVNLDNTLDEWLKTQVNQNQTVRNALLMYQNDITTDTVHGLRQSYINIITKQKEIDERLERIEQGQQETNSMLSKLVSSVNASMY